MLDNGTVRCWGSANDGRLGYGNRISIGDDETPGSVGPVDLGSGSVATAITTGDGHTCALVDNGPVHGIVRCWGYNGFGQLGYGNVGTASAGAMGAGHAMPGTGAAG